MRFLALFGLLFYALTALSKNDCQVINIDGPVEYPPYLWQKMPPDSSAKGAALLFLEPLSQKTQLQFQVAHIGSWARAQAEMDAGQLDMLMALFYNDARAQNMIFLQPPFAQSAVRIWMRPDQAQNIRHLEQLKPLHGATQLGFSLGRTFDNYAKENLQIARVRVTTP